MSNIEQATQKSPIYADAVLEGGGVLGIAHVGALLTAEKLGYQWLHIAGTSAGAIVGSLLAAGYTATELYEIMSQIDYRRFADNSSFNWFYLQDMYSMLTQGGIHTGQYIEDFLREKLQAKGKQKFGDLIVKGQEDDPRLRYGLTVIASDITTGKMLRLPRDAHFYGLDPDELDIARAVRMSAGVPFFFIPVSQQHINGSISRIVDGGILSNFPISIFDEGDEPVRPTIGFHFLNPTPPTADTQPQVFIPACRTFEILQALINTLLSASDRIYLDDHAYVRTVCIPTNGISYTKFDLSKEEIDTLCENGKKAAADFFATWDFEAYKAAYRSSNYIPTRQERLHADMKLIQSAALQIKSLQQEPAMST
ncbi:MAG: patatin-like phospholipase family protein [Ktedonobacteraceae bacterium]